MAKGRKGDRAQLERCELCLLRLALVLRPERRSEIVIGSSEYGAKGGFPKCLRGLSMLCLRMAPKEASHRVSVAEAPRLCDIANEKLRVSP